MDMALSDEQRIIIDMVRRFVREEIVPLERWFREMRIRRIGEGPSEVQKHVIARDILNESLR